MSNLLSKDFSQTIKNFKNVFRVNQNFDLNYRVIQVGNKKGCFFCIDGFVKDELMNKLQDFLRNLSQEDMPKNAYEMAKCFPYVEVDFTKEEEKIITMLLSGVVCLIIEGYEDVLFIDCRTYPMRNVQEPSKYKVLRGSRDGFVETLVQNAALIRRRIRSTQLSFEIFTVGQSSKTDVCICYMEKRVDKQQLDFIRDKIKNIKVDALTMNQESLAECLYPNHWWNPFPKFKYSERPDATAASVLEGHIILLVDNSPAAVIIPTTIFDVMEEADDYYFPPVTGTYLRFARTLLTLVSIFLTPLYMLLVQNPDWVPKWLEFINLKDEMYVPILLQLLILEIAIDGLKLAAINTPTMLNTPLSLIAALVIGEFAVKSGWFNAEVMLYMAVVAIATFTHESYELGYAFKFMRIIVLILTSIFDVWGFLAGLICIAVCIATNKTITGTSYLYPLWPFDGKILKRRVFRMKLKNENADR